MLVLALAWEDPRRGTRVPWVNAKHRHGDRPWGRSVHQPWQAGGDVHVDQY